MKEDSRDNDEHRPACVGVWEPHFRESIHQLPKCEGHCHDEKENHVLQNGFEGLSDLVDIDYLQGKVKKEENHSQDQEKVKD